MVIDVTKSVFGPGSVGVVCRQGVRGLEDVEGVMMIEVTLGFIRVHWEMGWGSWK